MAVGQLVDHLVMVGGVWDWLRRWRREIILPDCPQYVPVAPPAVMVVLNLPESVQMDEPEDQVIPKGTQEGDVKDNLLDDQWEDFSSLEEEEEMAKQIAEAEKALMKKCVRGQEEGRQDPGAPMTPTTKRAPAGRKTPAPKKTPASRKNRKEGEEMASHKEEESVKTPPPSSPPTPPPSKKKKVTQVIIPDNSPKTQAKMPAQTPAKSPAMRKTRTPATRMTPKMKRTLVFKPSTPSPKKFTIGRKASHKEEKVVIGMVKDDKRKLEDKQRRETQMEMVRKPLLATPNQMRKGGMMASGTLNSWSPRSLWHQLARYRHNCPASWSLKSWRRGDTPSPRDRQLPRTCQLRLL
jgi:hypothetical protein